MYLNEFSLRVPEGTERGDGYVVMNHGTQYSLQMRNYRDVRCDAVVHVDGKHVGTWRIQPNSNIRIERPAHDEGRFTFYASGTEEARQVGEVLGDPNRGLIQVTFKPEKKYEPVQKVVYRSYNFAGTPKALVTQGATRGLVSSRMGAGVTGLSGHSGQRFGNATQIDYDYSAFVTINLRLVTEDIGPRPLSAASPIPPPVS